MAQKALTLLVEAGANTAAEPTRAAKVASFIMVAGCLRDVWSIQRDLSEMYAVAQRIDKIYYIHLVVQYLTRVLTGSYGYTREPPS